MGRAPCCDKAKVKRGPWSPEEDATLKNYIHKHGTGGNWISLPTKAGLKRCGKSCRLRWLNYLRPDIKHGCFSQQEDHIICALFSKLGSRWSFIASQLPGRTDNDVKNYWNTKLKKKSMGGQIDVTSNNDITIANNNSTQSCWASAPQIETFNPGNPPCFASYSGTMEMVTNYYHDQQAGLMFVDQTQFLPVSTYPYSSSLLPMDLDHNGSSVLEDDGTLPYFGFESLNCHELLNHPTFQQIINPTSPYLGSS